MAKIAVAYYSLKGETIAPGMKIVNLEKGHTAAAAEFIGQAVGGNVYEPFGRAIAGRRDTSIISDFLPTHLP